MFELSWSIQKNKNCNKENNLLAASVYLNARERQNVEDNVEAHSSKVFE